MSVRRVELLPDRRDRGLVDQQRKAELEPASGSQSRRTCLLEPHGPIVTPVHADELRHALERMRRKLRPPVVPHLARDVRPVVEHPAELLEQHRRLEEGLRVDDADPEIVDRRMRVFHEQTEPLLDFYRDRGILFVVDAAQSPADVTESMLATPTADEASVTATFSLV